MVQGSQTLLPDHRQDKDFVLQEFSWLDKDGGSKNLVCLILCCKFFTCERVSGVTPESPWLLSTFRIQIILGQRHYWHHDHHLIGIMIIDAKMMIFLVGAGVSTF